MSDTTTSDHELVKISVPTGEGAPAVSEGVWAEPIDVAAGLYRIDSVALMTDGVSRGDTVRCEPSADNRLVAVEVIERSPNATLGFGIGGEGDADREAYEARLGRLAKRLHGKFGDTIAFEGGFGMLAVSSPLELLDQVRAELLDESGPGATIDDEQQRVGDWTYFVVSAPDFDVPEAIAGADQLLERQVEVVAVEWAGDDEIARAWPDELKDMLRNEASTNAPLRAALDDKRYIAAVTPAIRMSMMGQLGTERVGHQPFPIYPNPDDNERFEAEWQAAKDADGTVRWCPDDEANAVFRSALQGLGLDADADPRDPVA